MDYEQDIEEHEYTSTGDLARTVKIRLFLADEGMKQPRWMKDSVAECTSDGVAAAAALARYIHREGMRFEFWEKMEEVLSLEMCGAAFQASDRYGTVKAMNKGHPVQRGTSV